PLVPPLVVTDALATRPGAPRFIVPFDPSADAVWTAPCIRIAAAAKTNTRVNFIFSPREITASGLPTRNKGIFENSGQVRGKRESCGRRRGATSRGTKRLCKEVLILCSRLSVIDKTLQFCVSRKWSQPRPSRGCASESAQCSQLRKRKGKGGAMIPAPGGGGSQGQGGGG